MTGRDFHQSLFSEHRNNVSDCWFSSPEKIGIDGQYGVSSINDGL